MDSGFYLKHLFMHSVTCDEDICVHVRL